MSAVDSFRIQFEALLRGLTEGETEIFKAQVREATEEFLEDVFLKIRTVITTTDADTATVDMPKVFNYTGSTKPLTQRWKRKKAYKAGREGAQPYLWRGHSDKHHRKRLVTVLEELAYNDGETGEALFDELGGLTAEGSLSGSSALRPGLVISGYNGRPYNPETQKYVAWADAVDPRVNHYLKQAALMPEPGSGVRSIRSASVSVEGRRGEISIQRAVVEGLVKAGINVSFLAKLDGFLGPSSGEDELATILSEAGLIDDYDRDKMSGLLQQGHGIVTPWFGHFLTTTGDGTLTDYLKDAGIDLGT